MIHSADFAGERTSTTLKMSTTYSTNASIQKSVAIRAKWMEEEMRQTIQSMPNCTKLCGIMPRDTDFDKKVRTEMEAIPTQEEEEVMVPMFQDGSREDETYRWRERAGEWVRMLVAASDGACRGQGPGSAVHGCVGGGALQKGC